MKSTIVYWSGTGNTEAMAGLIQQGLETKGAEVQRAYVGEISDSEVLSSDLIVLGCPSMGVEVLEEAEFEPWFTDIENQLTGKNVALFGSYDWGDGQWMRDWEERTEGAGANVLGTLIVHMTPEGESEDECIQFGESLV